MRQELVIPIVLPALLGTSLTTSGCNENARVARVATEAAQRQAEQNQQMARVASQVTEGAKRLVEADAQARKELVAAHRELQAERAEIGRHRDQLEAERRQIAHERRTQSMLVPVLRGCAVFAVCGLAVAFCLLLLLGLNRQDDSEDVLTDLLVEELTSEQPAILPIHSKRLSLEQEPAESRPHDPLLPCDPS
jgi:hypothetical protein